MYNKKALRTIVNNLDKAKAPAKPKDIITDPMGQWKYPGQKTRIPGGDITMQGVSYPVWAQPNIGPGVLMQPNQEYNFPEADYVDETPIVKKGGAIKNKKRTFDPTSKNYKNGGVNQSPNLPLTAGREVYETFAYGMYDRPGWKKQDGGEAWDAELTDEEIQAYRDAGYQVNDLPEAQTGGYFSYGHKKYMKKNGKWLVESNGKYVPLSKNVEARTAELNKNAKYVKPSPVTKSQYQLDQEARRANYFNPDYSILPNIKQQVAESSIPVTAYDKSLQNNRTAKDRQAFIENQLVKDATIKAIKNSATIDKKEKINILMDPLKLEEYKYLGENKVYGDPNQGTIKKLNLEEQPNRLWEVITNPFTAFEYSVSGGGLANMPHNINQMRMAGIDPGVVEGRNLVGNALNTNLNLFDAGDKVVRNTSEGNYLSALGEASRFIPSGLGAKNLLKPRIVTEVLPNANIIENTDNLLVELSGLLRNKGNKKAIKEGNDWLKNWIDDPVTQGKIDQDFTLYNNRNNYVKDIYDLAYKQAKNFNPVSAEYSLKNQLKDYVNNVEQIHKGNTGVSYLHAEDPFRRHINNTNLPLNSNPRNSKSWISRSPLMTQAQRASTTVHEGTHDWVSDFTLNASNQKDYIYGLISPEHRELYNTWSNARRNGENVSDIMTKADAYKAYLADPTEVHARIMELRKHFKHDPKASLNMTPAEAQDIMDKVKNMSPKKRPVNPEFFKIIKDDPIKLSKLFNRLWATVPIAGAAYLGNNNYEQGGTFEIEADDDMIEYLKSQGYTVEDID